MAPASASPRSIGPAFRVTPANGSLVGSDRAASVSKSRKTTPMASEAASLVRPLTRCASISPPLTSIHATSVPRSSPDRVTCRRQPGPRAGALDGTTTAPPTAPLRALQNSATSPSASCRIVGLSLISGFVRCGVHPVLFDADGNPPVLDTQATAKLRRRADAQLDRLVHR